MASSLEALEALLQFRGSVPKSTSSEHRFRSQVHVPNPLDPKQPHLIEGDMPTSAISLALSERATSAPRAKPSMSHGATTVPNPLATSLLDRHPTPTEHSAHAPSSKAESLASTPSHGFIIDNHPSPMTNMSMPSGTNAMQEVEIRSDKIRDALTSKPQRGKKRHNLNDLERLELTRTRNREHAKSTRMKKKARLEELLAIEKKYFYLKEREVLFTLRRQRLLKILDSAANAAARNDDKDCPHSSRLVEFASLELVTPQLTTTSSVALADDNSGSVRVSACGTDIESGNPKTLSGVVYAQFTAATADVSSVSLYLSSTRSIHCSVGIFPSVSVLSFNP